MKKYYLILSFLIGGVIGVTITNFYKRSHYAFLKISDSENTYNDLVILDTETGDLYFSNYSDDYTKFKKRTYNK